MKRSKHMNKKLLLLPVLLMSGALSACAIRVEHVTLKDMLDKSVSNYATLYVNRSSKQAYAMVSDNDGSFFKLLKASIYEAEMVGQISNFQSTYNIDYVEYGYSVDAGEREMNYFDIRVYETGEVETCANGSGDFFYPKEQFTAYKMSQSDVKSLFTYAEDYARDYERTMAKREANISEFIYRCERNRVNDFGLRIQTNEEPPRQFTYDVVDKDGVILDIFKEIRYEEVDEVLDVNPYACITVAVRSDWRMFIDYVNGNGYMKYEYDSPFEVNGYGVIVQYFKVTTKTVVTNLYGTIFDMISDQYERDTQQ